MGDVIVVHKESAVKEGFLWIETIGMNGEQMREVSRFLQDAHIPYSFILADESLELLHPEKVAEKFQNISDFLLKKMNESTAEAPDRLWS